MSERRYGDQEVALILKRASESRATGATGAVATGEGLTLPQLKTIAVEAGIDPVAVVRAASALDTRESATGRSLLGTPVAPQFERVVDGHFAPEDLPKLLLSIRRVMGRQGKVSTEFDGMQWKAADTAGARYVSIQPMGERTLVRAFGNFRDGAIGFAMGGGTMCGVVTLALLKSLGLLAALGVGSVIPVALAAVLPARSLWRRTYARETRQLDAEVSEVSEVSDELSRLMAARTEAPRLPGPPERDT
ncbi:MAG: hypothetical protein ABIZ91_03240 [Gemmatimonadaceae bacterium]